MKINNIRISRRAEYEMRGDNKAEFKAEITLTNDSSMHPSITISLTEEQLEPIVGIVSQLVAANMQQAADEFHAEVQAALAGPVVEQEQIEHSTDVEETDDTFPDANAEEE